MINQEQRRMAASAIDVKVLISKASTRCTAWLAVFGPGPIEVERSGTNPTSYRVKLSALDSEQRRRLVLMLSAKLKQPVDAVEFLIRRRGVSIGVNDVTVVNDELFRITEETPC